MAISFEVAREEPVINPVLEPIYPYADAVIACASYELPTTEEVEEIRAKFENRNVIRYARAVAGGVSKITRIAVGLALEQSEGDETNEFIEGLVRPQLKSALLPQEVASSLVYDVKNSVSKIRTLQTLSRDIVEVTRKTIKADSQQQVELVKLLGQDPSKADETEGKLLFALQTGVFFEYLNGRDGSLLAFLQGKFEEGDTDSELAREILGTQQDNLFAINPEARSGDGVNKLVELIEFCAKVDRAAAVDLLCQPGAVALWPPSGAKNVLQAHKAQLIKNLHINLAKFGSDFEQASMLPIAASQEKLEQSITEMIAEAKRSLGNTSLNPREVVEIARQKKRKNRSGEASKVVGPIAAANALEAGDIEDVRVKELVFLTHLGEEAPEGSEDYTSCVEAYLCKHQGDVRLKSDLTNILDYLKKIDLSKGIARGIKKYKQPIRRGDRRLGLFALKPADATGLPTSSKAARKVRVLFTQDGNKIGLLGIVDRDEVPRFERSLGINSSAGA